MQISVIYNLKPHTKERALEEVRKALPEFRWHKSLFRSLHSVGVIVYEVEISTLKPCKITELIDLKLANW